MDDLKLVTGPSMENVKLSMCGLQHHHNEANALTDNAGDGLYFKWNYHILG